MTQDKKASKKSKPGRRRFLHKGLLGGAAALVGPSLPRAPEVSVTAGPATVARAEAVKTFALEEVSVSELQAGMKSGEHTSRSITEMYLARIQEIDRRGPAINSVIEVNPDALSIAAELDRERKQKGPRGPLHGIPVLIKDNIDTA